MSVDSGLLNQPRIKTEEQETEAGKEIKRNKRGDQASRRKESQKEARQQKEEGDGRSLRQELLRRKQVGNEESRVKKKAKSSASYPVRKGTKMALRWSWISLLITGGLSAGLSLLYLNFHLFCRNIMPSIFCKFGEEWTPRQTQQQGATAFKMGKKSLGILEIITLLILDALLVAGIIIIVSIMVIIIEIVYSLLGWFENFFLP